ncbi:MAG: HAD family hydrolase [Halobacteriota archaeon]
MRVVLDYGGTVVDAVDDSRYRVTDDPAVRQPEYVAYKAYSLGIIQNEDEYVDVLRRLADVTEDDCHSYLERRKNAVELPRERETALREIDRDHSLALFTDQVEPWIHETLERFGVDDLFDDVVVSSALGREKPHPEGYARLRDGYDDVLMVSDELNDDLLMADYFDMTTVWIPNDHETVYREPDYSIDDLAELPGLLDEIERGHGDD